MSDHVRRVQGLRFGGAAGPHKGSRLPRAEEERRAMNDQDFCAHLNEAELGDPGKATADVYCLDCGKWLGWEHREIQ